jgi:hypothetical protein
MRTEYSVEEILQIVKEWTTPAAIKLLNEKGGKMTKKSWLYDAHEVDDFIGITAFYKAIDMEKHPNTESLIPFVKNMCSKMFDKKKISIEKYKLFINGLSKWVHKVQLNLDNFMKLKKVIKKLLTSNGHIERNDKDPFVKLHFKAKLFVSKEEMNGKKARDKEKRDTKNMNVLYITQERAVAFYKEFCDKKTPDLVDKIITSQATLGLRIIEVLSSEVSNFVKEGDQISQFGTAKTKTNKYVKLSDKVCTKKPVIITADKFIELMAQIREQTDQFDLDNEKMTSKYDAKVNRRIIKYLRKADIPEHNELKSSHGMRRLFVSFSYSLREHHNMTFELWIQRMLAHDSSGSTMNYNTIKITTAKLLDEDSAAKLNLTYSNTLELKQ